jgi:aldose 1-epimerase
VPSACPRARYDPTMSEATHTLVLRAGGASAEIAPAEGGRIASITIDGCGVLKSSGVGEINWGCYLMAPWAGRLRDGVLIGGDQRWSFPTDLTPPHAIHGTVFNMPFEVVAQAPSGVELVAPLASGWPFGGTVRQAYALTPESLTVAVSIEAAPDGPVFPAIVGWHPWFVRQLRDEGGAPVGGEAELTFEAVGMLERGDDYLPTGRVISPVPAGPWDDCFGGVADSPLIRWPGALEVSIESTLPYWVVYTMPPDALCVEPQSGPPNGLNTGECAIVAPGRALAASMAFRWRLLR